MASPSAGASTRFRLPDVQLQQSGDAITLVELSDDGHMIVCQTEDVVTLSGDRGVSRDLAAYYFEVTVLESQDATALVIGFVVPDHRHYDQLGCALKYILP
jgi:hypothetical protein